MSDVELSDVELWSLVCGFFLPLGIAIVQQRKWSDNLRAFVAFLICGAAAAVTCAVSGELSDRTWVTSALMIVVAAIATFKGLWSKIGLTDAIEKFTTKLLGLEPKLTVTGGSDETPLA